VDGEGAKAPVGFPAKSFWPAEIKGDTDWQRRRNFVWQIFEHPEDNLVSQWVNFYILGLIVISAIVTVVETVPGLHKQNEGVWFGLECFFVMNFSIEFTCRISSTPSYRDFAMSGMNYIDIVSILPFYVDIIAGGANANLSVLRVLRLGRSLRLMKLSRYSRGIRLVTNAMEQSLDALQLFFFLLIIVMVVCSSAIYYTERGAFNEETGYWERTNPMTDEKGRSPFQSIPQSFWWCIVTLTTVGYGDAYPITYGGQIVGAVTMLLGLVMLALPLSIIGTNFIEERANMIREIELEKKDAMVAEGRVKLEAKDSQSLKSQLEETIDVINEVVKYQELISESMGDAIKLMAATKARQLMATREAQDSTVVAIDAPPAAAASTPGNETNSGSGLGAGVGGDTQTTSAGDSGEGAGVGQVGPDEKIPTHKGEGDGGQLIPVDAAVINNLEVLCKNVIKCCTNTEKAIL